jgi:hypothetical protein
MLCSPLCGWQSSPRRHQDLSGNRMATQDARKREANMQIVRCSLIVGSSAMALGCAAPGKLADMVALDGHPLTMPEASLLTMKVDHTVVGGKAVYSRPEAGV